MSCSSSPSWADRARPKPPSSLALPGSADRSGAPPDKDPVSLAASPSATPSTPVSSALPRPHPSSAEPVVASSAPIPPPPPPPLRSVPTSRPAHPPHPSLPPAQAPASLSCPSEHANVWQIRQAQLSTRYRANMSSAASTVSQKDPDTVISSSSAPPPDGSPLSVPPRVSGAPILDLIVDASAWPAPSEEAPSTCPGPKSSPQSSKVNLPDPSKKASSGKKIQWKTLPANITHNAPLPTGHPTSSRNRQSRRDSHPQGSKAQAARSSSSAKSSSTHKTRKNSAPAAPLPALSDKTSRSADPNHRSRGRVDQSPSKLASSDPLGSFGPVCSTDVIDPSSVGSVPPRSPPVKNPDHAQTGAVTGSPSHSQFKPGFIPRISPTIQPPAMALSAGPPNLYVGVATDLSLPVSTPGSLLYPHNLDGCLASDGPELSSINSAMNDLHVNAPQGNVWVNDPLVMSDGRIPVCPASGESGASAAMTFDSVSLGPVPQPALGPPVGPGTVDAGHPDFSQGASKSLPSKNPASGTRVLTVHPNGRTTPSEVTVQAPSPVSPRLGAALPPRTNPRPTSEPRAPRNHDRLPRKPRGGGNPSLLGQQHGPRKPSNHDSSYPGYDVSSSMQDGMAPNLNSYSYRGNNSHRNKTFSSASTGKGQHLGRMGGGGSAPGRGHSGGRSGNWRVSNGAASRARMRVNTSRERVVLAQPGRGGSLKSPEDGWVNSPQFPLQSPIYSSYGMGPPDPSLGPYIPPCRYGNPPQSPDSRSRTLSSGSLVPPSPCSFGMQMTSPMPGISPNPPRFCVAPHSPFSATYSQPPPIPTSYADSSQYPCPPCYYPPPQVMSPTVPSPLSQFPSSPGDPSGAQQQPLNTYVAYGSQERPAPLFAYPFTLDPVRYYVLGQCEYYFSADNLAKDQFLRSQMDPEGWVKIETICSFNRIKSLTTDVDLVCEVMNLSVCLDVDLERKLVRKKGDWRDWPLPRPAVHSPGQADFASVEEIAGEDGVAEKNLGGTDSYDEVCTSSEHQRNSEPVSSDGRSGGVDSAGGSEHSAASTGHFASNRQSRVSVGDKKGSGASCFDGVVKVPNPPAIHYHQVQPTISIGFDPATTTRTTSRQVSNKRQPRATQPTSSMLTR